MKKLPGTRPGAISVAVLGIVMAGLAGFALLTPVVQDQNPPPTDQSIEVVTCPADWVTNDGVSRGMPPGGNPCKDCKRPKGKHGCARLSCDPCCWVCQGEPLPLCTS